MSTIKGKAAKDLGMTRVSFYVWPSDVEEVLKFYGMTNAAPRKVRELVKLFAITAWRKRVERKGPDGLIDGDL